MLPFLIGIAKLADFIKSIILAHSLGSCVLFRNVAKLDFAIWGTSPHLTEGLLSQIAKSNLLNPKLTCARLF